MYNIHIIYLYSREAPETNITERANDEQEKLQVKVDNYFLWINNTVQKIHPIHEYIKKKLYNLRMDFWFKNGPVLLLKNLVILQCLIFNIIHKKTIREIYRKIKITGLRFHLQFQ